MTGWTITVVFLVVKGTYRTLALSGEMSDEAAAEEALRHLTVAEASLVNEIFVTRVRDMRPVRPPRVVLEPR